MSREATLAEQRLDAEREARLVERARREPEAFRELYRAYFLRVYAYVAYRVGRVQDVEDVVSETFLRAVEKLDRFEHRGEGSFGAWLFRIAHNQVSDFRCLRQYLRASASTSLLSSERSAFGVPNGPYVQADIAHEIVRQQCLKAARWHACVPPERSLDIERDPRLRLERLASTLTDRGGCDSDGEGHTCGLSVSTVR